MAGGATGRGKFFGDVVGGGVGESRVVVLCGTS